MKLQPHFACFLHLSKLWGDTGIVLYSRIFCLDGTQSINLKHFQQHPSLSITDQYTDTKLLTRILFRPQTFKSFLWWPECFGDQNASFKSILNRFKKVNESEPTHFLTKQMKYFSILESADLQKWKHYIFIVHAFCNFFLNLNLLTKNGKGH